MPGSYTNADNVFKRYVLSKYNPEKTLVLDVGPGAGKIYDILHPQGFMLECVEVHGPYIAEFKLESKYSEVYNMTIQNFSNNLEPKEYGLAVMGDVLEHLPTEEAQKVVKNFIKAKIPLVVIVPYLYPQGPFNGVQSEIHLQPDLTPKVMGERYPELVEVFNDGVIGMYVWEK